MTFTNNSAFSAGALLLIFSKLHLLRHTYSSFINNTAINYGGAIFSYYSKFYLENATSKFINNSAANGGAIALLSSTLELVNGSSNLTFENNSAKETGGAIYVDPDRFKFTSQIRYNNFYYLLETNCLYDTGTDTTSMEQHLYFINNLAGIAGDDIYGASLEWCNGSVVYIHPKNNSNLSSISGNPLRVCRCDNQYKPLCRNISHTIIFLFPTIQVRQFQSQL
jgi:predicted outer membrane repeat protein